MPSRAQSTSIDPVRKPDGVGHHILKHLQDDLGVRLQKAVETGAKLKAHIRFAAQDFGRGAERFSELFPLYGTRFDRDILQPVQRIHGGNIVFQPVDVVRHGIDRADQLLLGIAVRGDVLAKHVGIAAQYGQRGAQVVGKRGVETAALLDKPPHFAVVLFERGPHIVVGTAQPANSSWLS